MRVLIHAHRAGRALAAVGLGLVGIGMLVPAGAQPPGNNGTIKIDGVEMDTHPDDEPHASCTFQVDFYGYEANVPVTMSFAVQPPTGDEVIRTVAGVLDADDATGGGSETGLDGEFTIDLTTDLAPFTPQANQGYHVKLTITADDANPQGAQVKDKVFWVTGCGQSTATTSTTPTTTRGQSTTTETVLGTVITTPTTQGGEVLGEQLPRTGLSDSLLLTGFGLLALGLLAELVLYGLPRRSVDG